MARWFSGQRGNDGYSSGGDLGIFPLRVFEPGSGSIQVMDAEEHDVAVCRFALQVVRVRTLQYMLFK